MLRFYAEISLDSSFPFFVLILPIHCLIRMVWTASSGWECVVLATHEVGVVGVHLYWCFQIEFFLAIHSVRRIII